MRSLVILSLTLCIPLAGHAMEERVTGTPGHLEFHYLPIPSDALNPWPASMEADFQKRANEALATFDFKGRYGNTYFENEKRSYPNAFIDFLKGNRVPALKFLQQDDPDAHARKETLAVDWYPSFTVKSQVRKYFFFGQYLDPAYRKKMFTAAKRWTEKDPLNRPTSFYKGMTDGWNVESKNSWVDVRNTDNLRAMRDCAVYVMAEETGNKATADLYKERIRAYVTALYTTGMGEWDSVNYLSHTMTGYFQLYDYAKDPEVRLLAKAALDWFCTAAAVKYYKGNWAGPDKRDYGNLPIFRGAPGSFWIYFDDTPTGPREPESDIVHWITSPYRPPEAVVALARKNFSKPVEILSSKPSYDGWFRKPGGETEPLYHETVYIGNRFQVGTLPGGHNEDLCGFRMAADNAERGSDPWVLSTALKGYVDGFSTATAGGDRIAQYRNLIIQANAKGGIPFYFLIPKSAAITADRGVTFLRTESVWMAITPVQARAEGIDNQATKVVCAGKRPMPDHQVWVARGTGHGPCGLILEIGDTASHGSFDAFRKAVLETSKTDLSKLAGGEIHYAGSQGGRVGLRLTDGELPVVFRDGQEHDWAKHNVLFACEPAGPVSLGWKEGILRVDAGGKHFTGTLKNGLYTFENR